MKILSLAPTIWTERWMNRQQLLSRLGHRHTVLYSNASWYTWDRQDPYWHEASWCGGFKHQDNVWVESVPRGLMRNPRFGLLDQAVMRLHAARWRKWLAAQGEGPVVMHLFHPGYVDFIDLVQPDAVIYQPYDYFEFMPGWTDHLAAAEMRLLARADAIVTPSESFSAGLAKKAQRDVGVIPNGVDMEMFESALANFPAEPAELAAIPHPRMGYVGNLEPFVDLLLIAELAKRHAEWHFVVVGGRSPHPGELLEQGMEACEALPNVHFFGIKPRSEVPAYLLNMDVNLICLRIGEGGWADVAYPQKLQEYMACGLPIVSADLHAVRSQFSQLIRTAKTADEWEAAIDDALRTGGPGSAAARTAVARENSWAHRAAQLEKLCEDVLARRQPGGSRAAA